jgi:osmotically-inducible protein OsmY
MEWLMHQAKLLRISGVTAVNAQPGDRGCKENSGMQNDILLQRDVMAALDREESVIHGTIGVEVHHGTVKLAGRVSNQQVKERAEIAAHNVPGVTSIVMDIDVANLDATDRPGPI